MHGIEDRHDAHQEVRALIGNNASGQADCAAIAEQCRHVRNVDCWRSRNG